MQLWLNLRNRVPYQDFDDLEPKDCPPNPREEPKALLAPLGEEGYKFFEDGLYWNNYFSSAIGDFLIRSKNSSLSIDSV